MRRPHRLFFVLFLLATVALPRMVAAQTAIQHVSVTISPIVVMAVFGEPVPLLLSTGAVATAGPVRDRSSFYNLTTNVENVRLTAEIDTPMPSGTRLTLSAETTIGESSGVVDVSKATSPAILVSSISRGLENGQRLTYAFSSGASSVEVPFQSRTITLTLIDPTTRKSSQMIQTVFFGVTSSGNSSTTR